MTFLSSKRMIALMGLGTISAYSNPTPLPFARQLDRMPTSCTSGARRVSYDLGLGKNKPVYAQSSSYIDGDVYETAKFLVEHDGVVDFPGPNTKQQLPTNTPTPTGATTFNKPMAFQRGVPMHADAQLVAFVHPKELDLDTVWVELLIHEQLSKVNSATAMA